MTIFLFAPELKEKVLVAFGRKDKFWLFLIAKVIGGA
jgi:hypothetical protein